VSVAERFAANLCRLRRLSRLSQQELAERATIHRTHVGLLEHGKRLPRADTLVKLAVALEVSPNDLLQGIEWVPPSQKVSGSFVVVDKTDRRAVYRR
jgi:transcriptional regulator with XRE-family HTH domain